MTARAAIRPHKAKLQGRTSGARLALLLFIAATFAVQSFVTQTHIHFEVISSALSGKAMTIEAPVTNHGKKPLRDDPANCPICHQMAQAGHFLTPSAVAALSPLIAVSIVAIIIPVLHVTGITSHDWQGRAPPQL